MLCPNCHKDVAPDASFCLHCGASLTPAPASGFSPAAGYSPVPGATSQETPYAPVSGYTPPASSVPPSYGAQGSSYPPPAGSYPPQAFPPPAGSTSGGLSNNTAAALSYLTIIPAILFLVIEPYNKVPLVRFHSFQSIGLFIAAFVVHVAISFMEIGLHFMMGWVLFSLLQVLVSLGFFVLWLIAILKASKGEWYKLPLIGDFADKQARS